MKQQTIDIVRLRANPNNPRVIKDEKFAKLVQSIKDFPDMLKARPIVCNEDLVVLGGNMRLRACQEAGLKKVPVVVVDWNDEKQSEFIIKDNVGFGEWDWDKLANEWDEIKLEEWGLDVPEVAVALEEIPGQDEAPGLQEEAISRPGDIWILGNHRVMCGDSTNPDHMERLLAGANPDLVFTDPPYGVSIGDKNKVLNTVQKAGRCLRNIENDTKSPEELKKILLDVFTLARSVAADHCGFYVCSPLGGGLGMMMMQMMQESGLEVRHILNWVKNNATFSIGQLDYDYQHEPIMFTWKKTHKKRMKGEHRTSCWFIDKPTESKLHPTMKPVAIPENAILNSSDKGDVILDMFGGAGSTLIACEKTGRAARLMEIDPLYTDVIVRRWQETFSAEAILESDGQTFAQHEKERKR